MIAWLRRLLAPDSEEDEMRRKAVGDSLDKAHSAAKEAESAVDEARSAVKDYWTASDQQETRLRLLDAQIDARRRAAGKPR